MPMPWHLAQLNVGTARYDLDDPRMSGFMDRLDDINALADENPGFVWRLQTDSGNATDIKVTDNPKFILNMSVWQSVESLSAFVYRSDHQPVMADRRQWFENGADAYQVLWWIKAGTIPTVEDALERLDLLRRNGASDEAFTFRTPFRAPDAQGRTG
jgi:hypothetical protein